jgi:hypothetical protein
VGDRRRRRRIAAAPQIASDAAPAPISSPAQPGRPVDSALWFFEAAAPAAAAAPAWPVEVVTVAVVAGGVDCVCTTVVVGAVTVSVCGVAVTVLVAVVVIVVVCAVLLWVLVTVLVTVVLLPVSVTVLVCTVALAVLATVVVGAAPAGVVVAEVDATVALPDSSERVAVGVSTVVREAVSVRAEEMLCAAFPEPHPISAAESALAMTAINADRRTETAIRTQSMSTLERAPSPDSDEAEPSCR